MSRKNFSPTGSVTVSATASPRLTRQLVKQALVKELTAVANRVQKLIERANIKLAQVASDALGASGRARLRALADDEEDSAKLAEMAQGRMKARQAQLRAALRGKLNNSQRFILDELLDHYGDLEAAIGRAHERIRLAVADGPEPFVKEAVGLLQSIPGVGESVAQTVIAEIGVEMAQFPSDAHKVTIAAVGEAA